MSTPSDDKMTNNLIATGALLAILLSDDRVEVATVDKNTIMVTFPFLSSPYLVTIEIEKEAR